MNDERFETLLQEMRDERVMPGQIESARERVWRRLHAAGPLACEQLRPALGDYARGRLGESRRLLVQDHLGRCLDCRHTLAEIAGEPRVTVLHARGPRHLWVRWAVAASVLLAALYVGRDGLDTALAPRGPRATVESVSGTLLHLGRAVVAGGTELGGGEVVRTAAGSHAVLRLADGSSLEMNGRTELDLQGAWSGDTVRLHRGDVIIRAAEQGRRRLRVVTRDSIATVRGTVFAVSSGTAGSLVSVIEGQVAVSQPGHESLLVAGQQAASNPVLAEVGLERALSWSQDADDYYALLADLGAIEQRIAALTGSALRHEARLLPYLPAGAIAYVAIPNVDGAIDEALQLLDQRALPGTTLGTWWSSEEGRELRHALDSLAGVASLLREEIVVVLSSDSSESEPAPLLIAEIGAGGAAALRQALDALAADAGEPIAYEVSGSLLLISSTPEELARLASQIGGGAGSQFSMEIESRYREGVAWLAAVDLSGIQDAMGESAEGARVGRALGLTNARFLLVEQKTTTLGDQTVATVSFAGSRTGVASWLASPGPLGSAEYVSSEVILAASAATREPLEALDQVLERLGPDNELAAAIEEVERETGIRVRDDIVASLGTDFAFAIERPTVPVPGWVAVMEVNDPAALDGVMQRLVDAFNAHLPAGGDDQPLQFVRETVGGRTWRSVTSAGEETSDFAGFEWTYHLGYLIAAGDRALALRAIDVRDAGASLIGSAEFERRFPDGAGLHSSGFVWLNPEGLAQLATALEGSDAGWLAAGNAQEPVLVVVSGESARLLGVSRARLSGLFLDLLLGARAAGWN